MNKSRTQGKRKDILSHMLHIIAERKRERMFLPGKRIKPYQHWEPIYIGTNEVGTQLYLIVFLQLFYNFQIWIFGKSAQKILIWTVNQEPLYDERLSWEGRSDKMVQVGIKRTFTRVAKWFRIKQKNLLLLQTKQDWNILAVEENHF